ncbi:MAG: DUF2889 domain-containing protein [Desulfomonile tiedjei]|uniref:DUF2889 domain-containing protein n=1 Tax=Desulfomonile tiedjei TaxID=2358 RepID=A0A9D6Z329_9BACT|nr:DUF2889 domain-containing protein [Desulfomonile tiedjei]
MLAYSRTKSIGVQMQGPGRRVVSGILEDEMYGMECQIAVSWPELVIESVQARMKRFTTTRCPRAMEVFTLAEGWKLDHELDGRIKKEIGRNGCRHMAILMVDCCRSLARAEFTRELRSALEKDPTLDKSEFVTLFFERYPTLKSYLNLQ